ncbi:MAG: metal ABC transporter solute-binding protein, Zn/Mn family, partial [Candidatus Limnocylindrales bacterium]
LAIALAGCGDDDGAAGASGDRPHVVVTTNVLGDVVSDLVGDEADVEVIMPPGTAPHEFEASPRQVASMRDADVLVTNGAGFEEGLTDTIEAAEQDGVPTFAAMHAVDTMQLEGDGGTDPHFFTDPARMATAAQAIADFLLDEVPGLDTPAFASQVRTTVDELHALDREVERTLSVVPADRRTLVTNHEVFGYFADRYGFDVVGAIIPAGTTQAEPSAAQLDELAHTIEEHDVPAIFVETSSPTRLADALADEVGDVDVVELFSESLGEAGSGGETYATMMRTNAGRIADALTGASP